MSTVKHVSARKPFQPAAALRRLLHVSDSAAPILVMTHHKTGTVLLSKVLKRIAAHLNRSLCKAYGYFDTLPSADIVIFEHSLLADDLRRGIRKGVHIRRDPRDVVVSGYLYHLKTDEAWCRARAADHQDRHAWPVIPMVREHLPAEWKEQYLNDLDGRSYQQLLNELDPTAGLIWEMEHASGWAITGMLDWDYQLDNVLELKLEELVSEFDASFKKIFEHLGFSERLTNELLSAIQSENLANMSDRQIAEHGHIHSRNLSKWEEYFDDRVGERFDQLFPGAVRKLGYEV
ncbi:MAG: hypothetical protein HKO62_01375 [Gammaproteobacteria bacterium]|nr:sulfotransferase domain-containing protein [Gammaproteobacteria bacterium]NNL99369.1 hypothetical protein [Gammaproteobacteria bacterium]